MAAAASLVFENADFLLILVYVKMLCTTFMHAPAKFGDDPSMHSKRQSLKEVFEIRV